MGACRLLLLTLTGLARLSAWGRAEQRPPTPEQYGFSRPASAFAPLICAGSIISLTFLNP